MSNTEKFSQHFNFSPTPPFLKRNKRKFFCFGFRRGRSEAGGNAEQKLSVGITTRAERASEIISGFVSWTGGLNSAE